LRDIRDTDLYREVELLCRTLRQPGTGQISDATEVHVSPDGTNAVLTATLIDKLEGAPATRICRVHLISGKVRVLTFGPNTDRLPRYSPDGRRVAFLSDRLGVGDFQLYLMDPRSGAALPTPRVAGWVEYLHWSPDGKRILLGVAGHGADVSSGQGAVTSSSTAEDVPPWMPTVDTGEESQHWRRAYVYELAPERVCQVSESCINIWEAVWCGNEAIAAIASPGPGETLWYSARLHIIEISTGHSRELYAPQTQLGCLSASPSGHQVAVVEAICSDRWIVAGDLRLVDSRTGQNVRIACRGADITYTEWRSDTQLLVAGHRGFESVVSRCDTASGAVTELWASSDITTGGRYISVSGLTEITDFALLGESFTRAPEIAVVRRGNYQCVKSFDLGYAEPACALASVERVSWRAPDNLDIQGWLLLPKGKGPFPLVMEIHGGPVWHWRPRWLGRSSPHILVLLKRGYAVFLPNPRGSTGRGQDFARHVLREMGGADTYDYLSGLDHLVERGIADPERLGVTGVSYGGFMSCWLITQDSRFAAAIPVAPVTNHVSEYLLSNIPHFVELFLGDTYSNPGGKYFQRSPIMHARGVKTPTLNICGALDRCTPPEEAVQFHHVLLHNSVRSVLLVYPQEGHGIRNWPASLDYAARIVDWFEKHMARAARGSATGN
jgi:dipeptidyl aminopeptidase/acylaminoacyl peptidase